MIRLLCRTTIGTEGKEEGRGRGGERSGGEDGSKGRWRNREVKDNVEDEYTRPRKRRGYI